MSIMECLKAARAIGYLEGMSALWWTFVGEKLSDEMVAAYDEAVETLRKALLVKAKANGYTEGDGE